MGGGLWWVNTGPKGPGGLVNTGPKGPGALVNTGPSGVFQKAGYVTYPGKLTPQLTPSVVATLPVSCCNIVWVGQ